MSASAWVNTSQTTVGNIFSKTYYRLEFAANGILSWAVYETSSSSTFVYSTTAINDGQWHHIVVTHKANGNQNQKYYFHQIMVVPQPFLRLSS